MKEHPILFTPDNVNLILAGRKTETRRVMKEQSICFGEGGRVLSLRDVSSAIDTAGLAEVKCPHGKPGDLLWVREGLYRPDGDPWLYRSDNQPVMVAREHETAMITWAHHKKQDYCPSMFMPRWASRITLVLLTVRAERLQAITDEGARREGVADVAAYRKLWESINGKKHPWKANAYVWVLEFYRKVAPTKASRRAESIRANQPIERRF